MSGDDAHWKGVGGDDVLAAEYVLGVLDAEDRAAAAERIATDATFARRVDRWEAHFFPISEAIDPVDAPASTKRAIDSVLFQTRDVARPVDAEEPGWLSRLAFWKTMTFAALATAIAVGVASNLDRIGEQRERPPQQLAASLTSDQTDVRYVAVYDRKTNRIGLRRLAGSAEAERDFELWIIPPNEAPISLGVVPKESGIAFAPPEEIADKIASGGVFAITLEQAGGSPDGKPKGPVVAAGDLGRI
ncbi:MAG: anti-sigma factor [Pseudomonadota bacterium]